MQYKILTTWSTWSLLGGETSVQSGRSGARVGGSHSFWPLAERDATARRKGVGNVSIVSKSDWHLSENEQQQGEEVESELQKTVFTLLFGSVTDCKDPNQVKKRRE